MSGILTSYKVNDKLVAALGWAFILYVVVATLVKHPVTYPLMLGDEDCYTMEAEHLAKYGIYNTLSQGMSFCYSLLIVLFAKITATSLLVSARILTIIFFLISCRLLLLCLDRFTDMNGAIKYLTLTVYAIDAAPWLMRGLPDIVSLTFIFAATWIITNSGRKNSIIASALLLFIAFAIKPNALFVLPGFLIWLLFRKDRPSNAKQLHTGLFTLVFAVCFIGYHIPGYLTYHKLMLENKEHHYVNGVRVQNAHHWHPRNIYFEVYNPLHHSSKWDVTWEEVDSFRAAHPEIDLDMSYTQYVATYPAVWLKNLGVKVRGLAYYIQKGFFLARWTFVNRMVKSQFVIEIITFLILLAINFRERKFVAQNKLLLLTPLLYYAALSFYIITQLEDNWLLYCLPLLSLPVARFLVRYVNIILLLSLQFIYLVFSIL